MNTETAFLNAQVKPHFNYNALNTIAEYCETNPHEAEKLIMSLSKYLRGTLDFENLGGLIPLKKEFDLVRAYTTIEKARFEDIKIIFDVADSLPEILIPPLTIQPLVENAIKHGLRGCEGGGVVAVKAATTDGGGVSFFVEDNGAGIPEKKLDALLDTPKGSMSIGLYNINTRLFRLYGKGLSIQSTVNAGTSVSFTIPAGEGSVCSE
jgi:sensor histidine kinase YesM